MKVDHDMHVHTYLSACCADPDGMHPEPIANAAAAVGLETVGLADHVWANEGLEPSRWYRAQDIGRILDLKRRTGADVCDVRFLVGCEADTIAPGKFGITRQLAEQLDFVQLACSHFHMTGFVAQPRSDKARDIAEHCLTFFRSAVTSGLATIIPHSFLPLGHMKRYARVIEAISDEEFLEAFGMASERGVAIEITTGYLPPDIDDGRLDCALRFIGLAKQAGCLFTFGSDAHELTRIGTMPKLQVFIDELHLDDDDILSLAKTFM